MFLAVLVAAAAAALSVAAVLRWHNQKPKKLYQNNTFKIWPLRFISLYISLFFMVQKSVRCTKERNDAKEHTCIVKLVCRWRIDVLTATRIQAEYDMCYGKLYVFNGIHIIYWLHTHKLSKEMHMIGDKIWAIDDNFSECTLVHW